MSRKPMEGKLAEIAYPKTHSTPSLQLSEALWIHGAP